MEKDKQVINDEDFNIVDNEDGENLNFEDNSAEINKAIELINNVEFPTENKIFMKDLGVGLPNEEGDDEIIRKIIDKGLDYRLFYNETSGTIFRSTRPANQDGKELLGITSLSNYLKILKDIIVFQEDLTNGKLEHDDNTLNNLNKTSKF